MVGTSDPSAVDSVISGIRATKLSSSEDTAGLVRLHEDVWPTVVSHLSPESIENVVFTCHYFRTLAQPLFFRTLALRPFTVDLRRRARGRLQPRTYEEEEWLYDKLRYYSSPAVARHVKLCRINPRRTAGISELWDENAGWEIINQLFSLLPLFHNITQIDFDALRLTSENLKTISDLPHLERVVLKRCSTTAMSPVPMAVKSVALITELSQLPQLTEALFTSLLNPQVLETLFVWGPFTYAVFSSQPDNLHSLRTLCVQSLIAGSTAFTNFLEKIPALTELILYHKEYDPSPTPIAPLSYHLLPHLEVFDGPSDLVSGFANRPSIRHMRLSLVTTASSLLDDLVQAGCAHGLESLTCHVTEVTEAFLAGLFDERHGFKQLKALEIYFDQMDTKILTHFMPALHIPPTLQYLSITQRYLRSDKKENPVVLKKAHYNNHPALQYVAFMGDGYSWRFDPSTGAPLKTSQTIEDRRHPVLTHAMIEKVLNDF